MKLRRETAHLQRSVPVMSLVAAILRLKMRREQQLKLQLTRQDETTTKETR